MKKQAKLSAISKLVTKKPVTFTEKMRAHQDSHLKQWTDEFDPIDLSKLDANQLLRLTACATILRRFGPFEEFVSGLLWEYAVAATPDPAFIERRLHAFRGGFERSREEAQRFVDTYPGEVVLPRPTSSRMATAI